MTIAELILELQRYPQDYEVEIVDEIVDDYDKYDTYRFDGVGTYEEFIKARPTSDIVPMPTNKYTVLLW